MSYDEKELSQHLAKVAHDLRSPLQLISGHAELLDFKIQDEVVHRHVKMIVETTKYMVSLTDDMMVLYKGAEYENEILSRNVQILLSQAIENCVSLFAFQQQEGKIEVSTSFHKDFSLKNGFRLQRILQNLLSNSFQSCKDKLEAHISVKEVDGLLVVTLSDNSKGIVRDSRDVDPSEKISGGLGVFLVSELIRLFEGWIIWNSSTTSVVQVFIPLDNIIAEESDDDDDDLFAGW